MKSHALARHPEERSDEGSLSSEAVFNGLGAKAILRRYRSSG